jgi:hypothetical protein
LIINSLFQRNPLNRNARKGTQRKKVEVQVKVENLNINLNLNLSLNLLYKRYYQRISEEFSLWSFYTRNNYTDDLKNYKEYDYRDPDQNKT